jgi:hypothetical protein
MMDDIIPNGSKVKFKSGGIEGLTTGVCIRGEQNQAMEYEISYFINGEHNTKWVHAFEIEVKIDNSKPPGFTFHKNDKPLIGK